MNTGFFVQLLRFDAAQVLTLLFGIIVGAILCIGIKYPVYTDKLNEYKDICAPSEVHKYKIGITGKMYEVECKNGLKRYFTGN